MSDKEQEGESLFDLEFHEEAQVNGHTKVLRVPNGWVYTTERLSGNISSVFVPEYIPNPPQKERSVDDTHIDNQVCIILNGILNDIAEGKIAAGDRYKIPINRIIRQLQKRNQSSE